MTGDSSLGDSPDDEPSVFCCSPYARFSGPSNVSLAVTVSLIDGIFANGLKGSRLLGGFRETLIKSQSQIPQEFLYMTSS